MIFDCEGGKGVKLKARECKAHPQLIDSISGPMSMERRKMVIQKHRLWGPGSSWGFAPNLTSLLSVHGTTQLWLIPNHPQLILTSEQVRSETHTRDLMYQSYQKPDAPNLRYRAMSAFQMKSHSTQSQVCRIHSTSS